MTVGRPARRARRGAVSDEGGSSFDQSLVLQHASRDRLQRSAPSDREPLRCGSLRSPPWSVGSYDDRLVTFVASC
jgi:hypothetical protein